MAANFTDITDVILDPAVGAAATAVTWCLVILGCGLIIIALYVILNWLTAGAFEEPEPEGSKPVVVLISGRADQPGYIDTNTRELL